MKMNFFFSNCCSCKCTIVYLQGVENYLKKKTKGFINDIFLKDISFFFKKELLNTFHILFIVNFKHNSISQNLGPTPNVQCSASQCSSSLCSFILGIRIFIADFVTSSCNNNCLFAIGWCNGLLCNNTWCCRNDTSMAFTMMR